MKLILVHLHVKQFFPVTGRVTHNYTFLCAVPTDIHTHTHELKLVAERAHGIFILFDRKLTRRQTHHIWSRNSYGLQTNMFPYRNEIQVCSVLVPRCGMEPY